MELTIDSPLTPKRMAASPNETSTWVQVINGLIALATLILGGIFLNWFKDYRAEAKVEKAAKVKAALDAIQAQKDEVIGKEKIAATQKAQSEALLGSVNNLNIGFSTLTKGFEDLSAELKAMNNHLVEKITAVDAKVDRIHTELKVDVKEIHIRLDKIEQPKP